MEIARHELRGIPMPKQRDQRRNWLKIAAVAGTLGMDMVLFAGLGFWLGQLADNHWGVFPWGTCGGTLLGFIVAFWSICRLLSEWR